MAALAGNLQVLEKLWKCANETLIREELGKKLLLATDIMGKKMPGTWQQRWATYKH